MKLLIVGGKAQGKLSFALERLDLKPEKIVDGGTCSLDQLGPGLVLNRLEALTRRYFVLEVKESLLKLSEWVVICREIGCGVVPMDRAEREWREDTGRLCCVLAEQADTVVRLCCGIPTALKGAL